MLSSYGLSYKQVKLFQNYQLWISIYFLPFFLSTGPFTPVGLSYGKGMDICFLGCFALSLAAQYAQAGTQKVSEDTARKEPFEESEGE